MKIYLDTNVIRDCLKRRNLNTIRLLEIIREKKIECKSSIFSIMELIDVEKDDIFFKNCIRKGEEITSIMRKKSRRDLKLEDLNEIWKDINNLLVTYPFIEFINLTSEGWTISFDMCKSSNLDADDSIHLASATGCDVLLTSDSFFEKEGTRLIKGHNALVKEAEKLNLKINAPEEILEILEDEEKPKQDNSQIPIKPLDSKEDDELKAEINKNLPNTSNKPPTSSQ